MEGIVPAEVVLHDLNEAATRLDPFIVTVNAIHCLLCN